VDSGARAFFAHRPSNHRDNHESLHRIGGAERKSSAGAQGRRAQSDLCAESVRARAGVEGVCVRMRARGETLWSGRLTLATAGRAVDFNSNLFKYILSVWGVNTD